LIPKFEERTKKHIDLVNKYAKRLLLYLPAYLDASFLERVKQHDSSKFSKEERPSYEKLTDNFQKYKDEPDVNKAIRLHYIRNRHHPEFFDNANDMSFEDLCEMVCDWMAISEEAGTDCMHWFQKNRRRFKFNKERTDLIEGLIILLQN
jgi:hypothetical protein